MKVFPITNFGLNPLCKLLNPGNQVNYLCLVLVQSKNDAVYWKGGLKWTGPWNYDAMGRQLPPGSQCWYCNVWIGTKLPATGGSIAGDAASQVSHGLNK